MIDFFNLPDGLSMESLRKICKSVTNPNRLTNADKLRAMSDEELAEWLNSNHRLCPPPLMHGSCPYDKGCGNCWLDWLRQEVDDGGDD